MVMKIKCGCGGIVLEGDVKSVETGRGVRNRFISVFKPSGQIFRNKSNNPHNWTALCSKCQKVKA